MFSRRQSSSHFESHSEWALVAVFGRPFTRYFFVLAALAWALVYPQTESIAEAPLGEDWGTIETAHFRIHYEQQNRTLAERVAVLAEETHEQITRVFGDTVTSPTEVVIVHDVDTANGTAGVIPYPRMRLFAMAPEADGALGDSDDWLRNLIIHEYIHILHLNAIEGPFRVANMIFGRTYAPNQLLPRWFTEGFATYGESLMTEGGRLRNNAYRMILRMDVLHRRFRGTEHLSGGSESWPGAASWYLYGSDFIDYVASVYGHERWMAFIGEIAQSTSPLAVNYYAQQVFGSTIVGLWDEYAAAAAGQFQAEAVTVRARGETDFRALTDGHHRNGYPRCFGPQQVLYYANDGEHQSAIASLSLGSRESDVLVDVFGGGAFDASRDGRQLVFYQHAATERLYSYNDLFLVDRDAGQRPFRLTTGERAREPAFSADGRHIAYIAARPDGGVDLREIEIATRRIVVLYSSDELELVSMPSYSPDGGSIVFSLWRVDWGRDIYVFDRASGETRAITHDRAQDLEPSFTPGGEAVLFSSDRSGIYNIYSYALDSGELSQLSNVVGGLFSPRQCVEDGPIVARAYGAEGYDIVALDQTQARPPSDSYDRPELAYPERSFEDVVISDGDYVPWVTLYPRSWSPVVSQDGDSVLVGAAVAGADPAGHHAWTASASYSFETERPNVGLNYGFYQLPFNLSVFASYGLSSESSELFAESELVTFEKRTINLGGSISFNFFDDEAGHTLRLGYQLRDVQESETPQLEHDPSDLQPRFPVFGRFDDITLSWSWANARGFAHSLSQEKGTSLAVQLRLRSPQTGADFDALEATWRARQYVEIPWVDGHLIALQYSGGISRGGGGRRAAFGVGGPPERDFLLSIVEDSPVGSTHLRGYDRFVQTGTQFHLANVEYRMPLWTPDVGPWTLPFFVRRLYLAAFADYGAAIDELTGFEPFLLGVGGELRLQSTIGYALPASFRLGYAHGFNKGGEDQVYVLYGGHF